MQYNKEEEKYIEKTNDEREQKWELLQATSMCC